MDDKGFIFTIDAALALIPLFIVLATIANITDDYITSQSHQTRLAHDAQDSLEIMTTNGTLENITNTLTINNNNATGIAIAGQQSSAFLSKTLPGMKYNLTEVNQLNGTSIASNADMKDAKNIAVGVRNYGNYTFKLYVWD